MHKKGRSVYIAGLPYRSCINGWIYIYIKDSRLIKGEIFFIGLTYGVDPSTC